MITDKFNKITNQVINIVKSQLEGKEITEEEPEQKTIDLSEFSSIIKLTIPKITLDLLKR